MTLQAIRFKKNEDIQQFITKSISMGLIDQESKNKLIGKAVVLDGKEARSLEELYKNLLVATDGTIYFLNDLKQHLATATEQELQDSKVTFLTPTNKTITLAQIKNQASLCNDIEHPFDTHLILRRMNLNVFDSKSFPSLNSMKDIRDAIAQYDTTNLHIRTEGLKLNIDIIDFSLKRNSLVDFRNKFKYINTLHKDLLKLTVLAEEKLKQHLNKELTKISNKEEINAVNEWMALIEKNKEETIKYFQELSNCLPNIQTFIADKKLNHQRLLNDDPTLEKTKEKIKTLSSEKEQLMDNIEQKKKNKVLSQFLAVVGIIYMPAVLLPIAAMILVSIFAPAFILIPLGLSILGTALAITLTFINDMKVANSIGELVIQSLDNLKDQLNDLNNNLENLKEDVLLMQTYPEWNENIGDPNLILSELDSDIIELSQLKPSVELENMPNKKPVNSSVSTGLNGMFGEKKNNDPTESATPSLTMSP